MANTFRRQPIAGGDNNAWAPYLLASIDIAIGNYSSYLYNDSGTLKVSKGIIGIDNDTNKGVALIDTVTTITLSATNGIWQKIEMSVSGSAVTFTALDIAGKTDPSVIPTEFSGGYDNEKMGFYISSTKRCIGVIFKDSNGVLAGVVNAENSIFGYYGNSYLNTAQTAQIFWEKKIGKWNCHAKYQIGAWNMSTTASVTINHILSVTLKVKDISVMIISDTLNGIIPLDGYPTPFYAPGGLVIGGIVGFGVPSIELYRTTGGYFDATGGFTSVLINRGNIFIEIEE